MSQPVLEGGRAPRHGRLHHGGTVAGLVGVAGSLALLAAPVFVPAAEAAKHARSALVVNETTNQSVGMILVSVTGFTLYHYTPDKPNKPTCTGSCTTAWPPFLLPKGVAVAKGGTGVTGLGSVSVAGGRRQVTYHGTPLYRFVGDTSPGSANGQGTGGIWFVVHPQAASANQNSPGSTSSAPSQGGYGY